MRFSGRRRRPVQALGHPANSRNGERWSDHDPVIGDHQLLRHQRDRNRSREFRRGVWPSQTQQFTSRVADAANTAVAWTLTPANAGSVTADGLYTAPSVVTALQSVTLTATDFANSSWSTIATINLYSPGSLMLSPASANLMAGATQQFTPTLTNGIATDVTWSLNSSSAGSISATGLYTAPPVVAALQTVTVTATTADLDRKSTRLNSSHLGI